MLTEQTVRYVAGYTCLGVLLLFTIIGAQAQECNYANVEEGCEVDVNTCFLPSSPLEIAGVNKEVANVCDHRYLISLQEPWFIEDCYRHYCGGSLIAPDLVLTARHCLQNYVDGAGLSGQLTRQLYAARAPKCRHHTGEGRYNVTNYWMYPDFNFYTFVDDIAILQIDTELPGPYLSYDLQTEIQEDDDLSILGWGKLDKIESGLLFPYNNTQLRIGREMRFIPTQECQRRFVELGERITLFSPEMICAQGEFLDSCTGDSGGPLIINQDGQDVLVGIISFGVGNTGVSQCITFDNVTRPGVFTNISHYSPWINSIVDLVQLQKLSRKSTQIMEEEQQQQTRQIASELMQRTFYFDDYNFSNLQTNNTLAQTENLQPSVQEEELSPQNVPIEVQLQSPSINVNIVTQASRSVYTSSPQYTDTPVQRGIFFHLIFPPQTQEQVEHQSAQNT